MQAILDWTKLQASWYMYGLWPAGGTHKCLEVTGPQTLRLETTPDPHNYTFDCVAGEAFSQEALYNGDHCIRAFVQCCCSLTCSVAWVVAATCCI